MEKLLAFLSSFVVTRYRDEKRIIIRCVEGEKRINMVYKRENETRRLNIVRVNHKLFPQSFFLAVVRM